MEFSAERYRRGPALAFIVQRDSLVEMALDPMMLQSFAVTAMISGRPRVALDLLELPETWRPADDFAPYWRAWPRWALGDTAGAKQELRAMGMTLDAGPTPEVTEAVRLVAVGDTARAMALMSGAVPRHALDADAHSYLGALLVHQPGAEIERRRRGLRRDAAGAAGGAALVADGLRADEGPALRRGPALDRALLRAGRGRPADHGGGAPPAGLAAWSAARAGRRCRRRCARDRACPASAAAPPAIRGDPPRKAEGGRLATAARGSSDYDDATGTGS